MSITQEQIQKIAEKLSKIRGNNEKLVGNIQDIVGYMELLSEVNTDGVIPTVSVIENSLNLREDVLKQRVANPSELLACSQQKVVGGQIILPNIMH